MGSVTKYWFVSYTPCTHNPRYVYAILLCACISVLSLPQSHGCKLPCVRSGLCTKVLRLWCTSDLVFRGARPVQFTKTQKKRKNTWVTFVPMRNLTSLHDGLLQHGWQKENYNMKLLHAKHLLFSINLIYFPRFFFLGWKNYFIKKPKFLPKWVSYFNAFLIKQKSTLYYIIVLPFSFSRFANF